jgi:MFS family permease
MTSRNRLLGVLAFGHGATHWHPGTMSVALPLILKDLGMSYTQMGFVQSFQQIVVVLSTVMGGLAIDLLNQRKAILIFSVIWPSVIFSMLGFANSFAVFAVLACMRLLFGGFFWHPPARSVIGETFPDRMGFALGIHTMGGNFAQALAPIAIGALLWFITWRSAFKLHFIVGVAAAYLLYLLLPPLGKPKEDEIKTTTYLEGFKSEVLGNLPLLGIALVAALRSAGENVIPTFLPLYLSSLALVGTVAAPFVGYLSDRWGRKPAIFLCLFSGGLVISLIPFLQSPMFLFPLVSLGGVVLFSGGPIIQADGLEHSPRNLWGAAQTLLDITRATLSFIFPLLAGWMADWYGLSSTFYLFGAANFAGAFIILSVPHRKGPEGRNIESRNL